MDESFRNPHPDVGKIGYLTIVYGKVLTQDQWITLKEPEPATLLSVHHSLATLELGAMVRNERTGDQMFFTNKAFTIVANESVWSVWVCVSSKKNYSEFAYLKWRPFKMEHDHAGSY